MIQAALPAAGLLLRTAGTNALKSAAKWAAGTALAGAATTAAMDAISPDEPEPKDGAEEEGQEEATGLVVTPAGHGTVRVAFPVDSPKAIHLTNALAEFGEPVSTGGKDGKQYKVYTLTQREFERLQAQGGSR